MKQAYAALAAGRLEVLRAREQATHARIADLVRTNGGLRTALDNVPSRGSPHRSYDELISVAVEICGAAAARVCFANEAEGLLTTFGASAAQRGAQAVPLSGPALKVWRQVRDADDWLWLARDACIPICRHGMPIGYLALTFAHVTELTAARLHVVRMLAQQASLGTGRPWRANHRDGDRLVRAPAKAIDEQVASLVQVNESLRASSDRLESDSLDRFLETIVRHAVEISGASAGSLALPSPDEAHLEVVGAVQRDLVAGKLVAVVATERTIPLSGFARDVWEDIKRAGEHLWQPLDQPRIPALMRRWYESRGYREALLVPIRLGGTTFGQLALIFGAQGRPSETQLQVARVLAQQSAVAIRMKSVGDSARQAAIKRERVAATEAERARMAGEIHDGLAQAFLAVMMQARAARISRSRPRRNVAQFLDRIEALATEGLEEARRSVFALRSIAVENEGLLVALKRLAGSLSIPGRTQCLLVNRAGALEVSPAVEDAVYRIVQEAMQNALKHAGAREVKVVLGQRDGRLEVDIEDDGLGIPDDVIQRARERGGLRAMRDRAVCFGGSLVVEPRTPRGTRVAVLLPLRSAPK
jgi:signal transduction histidine kinase